MHLIVYSVNKIFLRAYDALGPVSYTSYRKRRHVLLSRDSQMLGGDVSVEGCSTCCDGPGGREGWVGGTSFSPGGENSEVLPRRGTLNVLEEEGTTRSRDSFSRGKEQENSTFQSLE